MRKRAVLVASADRKDKPNIPRTETPITWAAYNKTPQDSTDWLLETKTTKQQTNKDNNKNKAQ